MKLKDLIADLRVRSTSGDINVDVTGITYDSRQVVPGDLFVAIQGFKTDGGKFTSQAVKSGAVAVVCREKIKNRTIPQVIVEDPRQALALLSNRLYDFPSRKLKLIGVTGTNGKTTICYLLEHILRSAGLNAGIIGTVETRIAGQSSQSKMTTPESSDLQKIFVKMLKLGVSHVVMEVSSHSLALDRVLGVDFDTAIMTNLTHDHLDFHKTMEEYFKAKLKLFYGLGRGTKKEVVGIINNDDPYAKKILDVLDGRGLTYGMGKGADLIAKDVKYDLSGMGFSIARDDVSLGIKTGLIGVPNVYNILASIMAAESLDLDVEEIRKAIESFPGAPGRYERVEAGQPFPVVVDFAHSPDSLQKLIETYRPLVKGKIIIVFGCPGDRDRDKRPIMGEIAVRLADRVIISTDDPHSEDPGKIIEEIEKGVKGKGSEVKGKYEKILDRREAITKALSLAGKDDIVLIAGRGHEKYQDFNGEKVEIDDREVVKKLLAS